VAEKDEIASAACVLPSMNLYRASSPREILAVKHPHIGRIERMNPWRVLFGILRSKSARVDEFESQRDGKWESVALSAGYAPDLFMLTVGAAFVLLTMRDGSARVPIIQKRWQRKSRDCPSKSFRGFMPIRDTYRDSDELTWVHSYGCNFMENELVAYDLSGSESVRITTE
jgi:hypothetical protein